MAKCYWKPHFVVKEHTMDGAMDGAMDGVVYYSCGIKEVYYIDDRPTMWSSEFKNIESTETSDMDAIDSAKCLLELYAAACENVIYKEVHIDGKDKLIIFDTNS